MKKPVKKPSIIKKASLAFAFDTETTGLIENVTVKDKLLPEVIDFYGCIFDMKSGKIEEELDLLIKPSRPISEEITNITSITNKMVAKKKSFKEHSKEIKAIIEKSPLAMAHNAAYDHEVINIEMERIKDKVKWPRVICTVEQTMHIKGYRLGLTALHEHLFGEGFPEAHRAKTDVHAQMRCVVELVKRGEFI